VRAQHCAQRHRGELLDGAAAQRKHRFLFATAVRELAPALDARDLRDVWEGPIARCDRPRHPRSGLDAAVAFVPLIPLRGKTVPKWWAYSDLNREPRDSSLRTFRCSLDYVFTRVRRRVGDGGWCGD